MTEANILRPEDSARASEAFVRAAEIQAIHAKKVLTMHDVSVVLKERGHDQAHDQKAYLVRPQQFRTLGSQGFLCLYQQST